MRKFSHMHKICVIKKLHLFGLSNQIIVLTRLNGDDTDIHEINSFFYLFIYQFFIHYRQIKISYIISCCLSVLQINKNKHYKRSHNKT